jgi:hypothetical protein
MRRTVVTILCLVHILTFAVCTYIAAIKIETILATGWICSSTGLIAGIGSLSIKERALAVVSFLTPIVAIVLTALEALILNLGPNRASLPFCIVFIIVQLVTTVVSFRSFRFGSDAKQISLRTMLLATTAFSVVFAVARQLLHREHNVVMLIALTLAGLTFVGTVLTINNWITSRGCKTSA